MLFLLLLFIGTCNAQSYCQCGKGGSTSDNIDVIDAVNRAIGIERINETLGRQSKQMCLSYIMKSVNPPVAKFTNRAINNAQVTDTCKAAIGDGSRDCPIEDPFIAKNKCFPAQYFCVHQVVCPSNQILTADCESLGLPKGADGETCLDALVITSGRKYKEKVCGRTNDGCFEYYEEAGGNVFRATFVSGLCCQNCGYRIKVRCVPRPRQSPQKRDIEDHSKIEERAVRTRYVVPFGAKVTFNNSNVTVALGNRILRQYHTDWFRVKDRVAFGSDGWFRMRNSTNRTFVGYGIMNIYRYPRNPWIDYYQQGVPPEEILNESELKFIEDVNYHLRGTIKSTISIRTGTQRFAAGTLFSSGNPKPSCQNVGDINPSKVSYCPSPSLPPKPEISSTFVQTAKRYAGSSTAKSSVRSLAKLFLKYGKYTRTPIRPVGPPGPRPRPGVGPPGLPPTRG